MFGDSVPFDPYGLQAAQMYGNLMTPPDAASIQSLAGFAQSHGASPLQLGSHGANPHQAAKVDPANALVYQATLAASIRDAQIAWAANQAPPIGPNFQAQTTGLMGRIDAYNAAVVPTNSAVYASLRLITGQNLPEDPEAWKSWWVYSLGFSYKSPQSTATARPRPTYQVTIVSCFAAGTMVRTLTGDRPIETLKIGDQVLTQRHVDRRLGYQPIVGRAPQPARGDVPGRAGRRVIVATGFHRFWKAGKGWVMARELEGRATAPDARRARPG